MKRKLSDALYEYLKKAYPKEPSVDNIIEVCKAAVSIFPLIKVDPSSIDGIVIIPITLIFEFFMYKYLYLYFIYFILG